jgi:Cu(I)/Ag(I) efflux system membrane fusion protein
MSTLANRQRSIGAGTAIAAAFLLVAFVALQYGRARWPFGHQPSVMHVHETTAQPAPMTSHAGHGGAEPPASPQGYAPVMIDPSRAAALQLATAPVEERELARLVRTVGVIALDETRSAHVHSKVRGWIDGIHVNFVGQRVRAGEPLCSIYSQDVYSAEIEFISILGRTAGDGAQDPLLEAARHRLALWDVPSAEIERLERTREPRRTFPLLAPRTGTVVAKEATQGTFVDPSLELYTLSDLSRVWVLVDVYEADVPYVHVGDTAKLTIEGQSQALTARIAFLTPTLDEATRTRKVRLELANPAGRFLPGAFASAEMNLPMGRGLAIPESAVIRTGARAIVFVAHGQPPEHLEPREVTLGPLIGDRYRVEAGVAAGEQVATSAQFLLDSESRLRATSGQGGGHVHSH